MNEIGQRFTQIRKKLGMTQREFAEKLDVSMGSVQAYENGKLPKGDVLNVLSNLGYSLDWLFAGKGKLSGEAEKAPKSYDIGLERLLIWNVAYYMCKRTEATGDPEVFADTFMDILDSMKAQSTADDDATAEADDFISNVIDFTQRRSSAE